MRIKKQCTVHLYTGEGSGKTTVALGVALRSVGHGQKVVILQFMKGRKDIGEYRIMERLRPEYKIYQFGTEEWVDLDNPSEKDGILANKGIDFLRELIENNKIPELLILEELNLAAAVGLVKIDDVIDLISSIPGHMHIYITGRRAPQAFVDFADFVTEIRNIKAPEKMEYAKGIEY